MIFLTMIFSLVVKSAPNSANSLAALEFAKAISSSEHTLFRLFFLGKGVMNAEESSCTNEESDRWSTFIQANNIDAVCCIGSAKKWRLIDENNTGNNSKNKILPGFSISGLGQLVEANSVSDRVVTF